MKLAYVSLLAFAMINAEGVFDSEEMGGLPSDHPDYKWTYNRNGRDWPDKSVASVPDNMCGG